MLKFIDRFSKSDNQGQKKVLGIITREENSQIDKFTTVESFRNAEFTNESIKTKESSPV